MLVPAKDMNIFVALNPVDMRKAINGLVIEIVESLGEKPQSGNLFIFRNRNSSLLKELFWDIDGFVLIYKRLEKYNFKFPKANDNNVVSIDNKQLRWLLSGFDFTRINENSKLKFDDYF